MTKNNGGLIGVICIAAGAVILFGQQLNLSNYLWPFFVIFPGLGLFMMMYLGGKKTTGLAIPASIVTAVGLILFSQNITGRFETWAYSWALVQASLSMGMILQGRLQESEKLQAVGSKMLVSSLIIFTVFAGFFELLVFQTWANGLLGSYLLPFALIAIGITVVKKRQLTNT